MDIISLCICRNMFLLLVLQTKHSCAAERSDKGFPNIFPDRLQFFEYEAITVNCELIDGLNASKVMRKFHEIRPTSSLDPCSSLEPFCTIYPALEAYSGEYWCEDEDGGRSNSVNLSITVGSVILEVPSQPVREGSDVTLPCIHHDTRLKDKMKTELNYIRDFYKNGLHLMTYYITNMTIQNVTKADEGFYSCSISGAGESPDSWLAVKRSDNTPMTDSGSNRLQAVDKPLTVPNESPSIQSKQPKNLLLEATVRLVFMTLFCLVIALIYYKKHKETSGSYLLLPRIKTEDPNKAKAGPNLFFLRKQSRHYEEAKTGARLQVLRDSLPNRNPTFISSEEEGTTDSIIPCMSEEEAV